MEIYNINMVVIIDIDIWNKVDLVVMQKAIRPTVLWLLNNVDVTR
jgi:hypothetical protein